MPIRINLLAEAQALEESRRRDPVKRVIMGGIIIVLLILAYSSSLFVQTMANKVEVNRLASDMNSRTNQNEQILANKRSLDDGNVRLAALNRLATNRFLVGTLLNSLQKTTVDNVQLVRLKIDQNYLLAEETKATNGDRTLPKPATTTEKIVVTLNARDNSAALGDGVKRYQDNVSGASYFQECLGKAREFRLTSRGVPQADPDGKSYVLFTLEGRFIEKTR
jgi:hypothetical protein